MNKATRALLVAFMYSVPGLALVGNWAPASGAAAVKVENKALADAVNEMNSLERAGNLAGALAKAKEVDAIPGKPAQLTRDIHNKILALSISAKDYPSALAQIDKMVAANEGNKQELLGNALAISLQSNNKAAADKYQQALGGNIPASTRLFIADGMRKSKQYKEALDQVQPLMQVEKPTEDTLRFVVATNFEMGNAAGRRAALEQLVLFYGKPGDWHDLLQLARNEKGLNDQQKMDIMRLRLAVGDVKSDADFIDMAQQAMVANYNNEAKQILDKGTQAKVLNGERAARLVKKANDDAAKDSALEADLQAKAKMDAGAGANLGLILWSYGKNKEAEDAIRQAMTVKAGDVESTKLALGHVLLAQGKKPEAAQTFGSVARNNSWAGIGRLWSIYARRG
jgi:tetratricopeptide (TPR) repeat protein